MIRKRVQLLAGAFSLILLLWGSASAEVNVYAEGAYTQTDLKVYIYADVTGSPLVSYGVKLMYNPAEVDSPTVRKNTSTWYFGSSASPLPTPNAEPDISTPGEVIIVGGKINEAAPTEGVIGSRKLIADVTFSRVNPAVVPSISLDLGKGGAYANFVQVDGTVLDNESAPTFSFGTITIKKRGDANADGLITGADRSAVQYFLTNGGIIYPWMDCNGDESITGADRSCIKYLLEN